MPQYFLRTLYLNSENLATLGSSLQGIHFFPPPKLHYCGASRNLSKSKGSASASWLSEGAAKQI